MQRTDVEVNADYTPEFNMDRSITEKMLKAITIRFVSRSDNKRLKILYHFKGYTPATINYIPMYLVDGQWQRSKSFPDSEFCALGENGMKFTTRTLVNQDQQFISIRLIPNKNWQAKMKNNIPPWGHVIEFLDLPLPSIGQGSDVAHTGQIIFKDHHPSSATTPTQP